MYLSCGLEFYRFKTFDIFLNIQDTYFSASYYNHQENLNMYLILSTQIPIIYDHALNSTLETFSFFYILEQILTKQFPIHEQKTAAKVKSLFKLYFAENGF